MFKQVLLLALAVASVSANLDFTNCGGQSEVTAFRLRGCDQLPCRFVRGQEYYGEMDVVAAAPTPSLPFVIQAILGFPLPPVTIFSGDACEDLTRGYCPTVVGEDITARLYMDIPTTLPAISTNVRATVRDALNQIQVCVQIPVTLV
ncbi:hypothetical protein HA402_014428 [Bradysia odoriphaga]|nr:hypothetical protein HA402_014428 [Bradysia odoriphaga]